MWRNKVLVKKWAIASMQIQLGNHYSIVPFLTLYCMYVNCTVCKYEVDSQTPHWIKAAAEVPVNFNFRHVSGTPLSFQGNKQSRGIGSTGMKTERHWQSINWSPENISKVQWLIDRSKGHRMGPTIKRLYIWQAGGQGGLLVAFLQQLNRCQSMRLCRDSHSQHSGRWKMCDIRNWRSAWIHRQGNPSSEVPSHVWYFIVFCYIAR